MTRWIKRIASLFPAELVGFIEYHVHPRLVDVNGGGFNGQCFRQLIFIDLLRTCRFEAIVETGTFRGATTAFMARNAPKISIFSSELNRRYMTAAKRRLRGFQDVHLFREDSRRLLRRVDTRLRTFFYLDAHWYNDLPLREETEYIFSSFRQFVVMIDDFEVPGDPGYTHDDYGPDKDLSLRNFSFQHDSRVSVYFPNRPSSAESESKRGCVVLASPELAHAVDQVPGLSRFAPEIPAQQLHLEPRVNARR